MRQDPERAQHQRLPHGAGHRAQRAHQADADRITAVLLQFPRPPGAQERPQGITAQQVARLIEIAGAHRVITDIHAQAISGFDRATLDDLHASGPLQEFISKTYPSTISSVLPAWAAPTEPSLLKRFATELAIVDKERDYSAPTIARVRLVGEVRGKDVLMVDDIVETRTIIAGAELLKERAL